jgi:hypothetical protein
MRGLEPNAAGGGETCWRRAVETPQKILGQDGEPAIRRAFWKRRHRAALAPLGHRPSIGPRPVHAMATSLRSPRELLV